MADRSVSHRPQPTAVDWHILRDELLDALHVLTRRAVEATDEPAFRRLVELMGRIAPDIERQLDGPHAAYKSTQRARALLDSAKVRLDRMAIGWERKP